MDIIIKPVNESPFTLGDVVDLMHRSFEERMNQGLHFTCSSLTVEQFQLRTKNSIVLVAWNSATNVLLGTATVTLRKDKRGVTYGYHEYLAISPNAKRLGIGTKLLEERIIIIIINAGGEYVMSDTAVGAESSVRWHLKNGFKIIALRSFPSTNYYSYIFRRQLVPSKLWDSCLYTSLRFRLSSIIVKSLYNENGSNTKLGNLVYRILKK